jgi:hypothetical protein
MRGMKLLLSPGIAMLICVASAFAAGPDVRTTFQKFVSAQNAHDLASLKPMLLDSPDFLWVAGGVAIWGRDAAMREFAALYKGTWKLEPNMAGFKSHNLDDSVVAVFVPITVTVAAAGKKGVKLKLLMSQIYMRVGNEWKLVKILSTPSTN